MGRLCRAEKGAERQSFFVSQSPLGDLSALTNTTTERRPWPKCTLKHRYKNREGNKDQVHFFCFLKTLLPRSFIRTSMPSSFNIPSFHRYHSGRKSIQDTNGWRGTQSAVQIMTLYNSEEEELSGGQTDDLFWSSTVYCSQSLEIIPLSFFF